MSTNPTHRSRLARALAEASGISYQIALSQVTEAAAADLLPGRLDTPGMRQALVTLLRQNPASHFRVHDAARYLAAAPGRLPEAICAFAGQATPAGPVARRLMAGVLEVLGSASRGILMVHDLAQTADDWPGEPDTLPPTPGAAVTLVRALAGLLDPLTADELRDAAAGFALLRIDLYLGLRTAEMRRPREVPRDGALPLVTGDNDGPGGRFSVEDYQDRLAALRDTPPRDWTGGQRAVVFKEILEHMARTGDALMRVTQHVPAPLKWDTSDALCHTAFPPVPGSAERLEARLCPEPANSPVFPESFDPLWPDGPEVRPLSPWRWSVGWCPPGGEFISQDGTVERTREAAVFGAEQTVAWMLARAPQVRQRWTGRLLVPRQGPPDADDPVTDVVSWNYFLVGVRDEDFSGSCTVEEFLVSVFDSLGTPYPRVGDPAAGSRPGDAAFSRFLASHAVILAPPVRVYLNGVASAAGDGQRVQDHHAAGLSRVLEEAAAQPDGSLAADMGPLPAGMAWTDLYRHEELDRFAAAT
jgi:hypothetical protein